MSGHNTPYHLYQGPLSQLAKVATSGSIAIDRNPCYVPVDTTAGAAALTLVRPTKAGVFATICLEVDGGDLTLTVTGGYNAAGDTSIVFADAGDAVLLQSIKVGGVYYWNLVQNRGTDAATGVITIGDAVAAEHGAGAIGTAFAPRTYRYTRDGTIITEVQIDLTGLDSSGVANDVIGLNTGGAAYIGRNVVATNGIIYKVEMTCLELPATGDADIILVAGSAADEAFDDTVADTAAICDGTGDWVASETIVNIAPAITANYYYYLTQGATDDATYTAGQFLIRFYGHPLLS